MPNWEWLGHPQHLCVSASCRFHLGTLVGGRWIISTVGDYYRGEIRETVGPNRYFETMVFRAGDDVQHCGCPSVESWSEVDLEGYQTAAEATAGHMDMCRKWEDRTDA